MASTGYFRCMTAAAPSSTRCLRGCPFPVFAVIATLRPKIRPTATVTPEARPMPADLAIPGPQRCKRDLSCADSMRAPLPGPGHPNRFNTGDTPTGREGSCGSRRPDSRDGLLHQRWLPLDRLRVAGPGPGLPIVAAIARAHHATLTISPRPGGGLNITFPT